MKTLAKFTRVRMIVTSQDHTDWSMSMERMKVNLNSLKLRRKKFLELLILAEESLRSYAHSDLNRTKLIKSLNFSMLAWLWPGSTYPMVVSRKTWNWSTDLNKPKDLDHTKHALLWSSVGVEKWEFLIVLSRDNLSESGVALSWKCTERTMICHLMPPNSESIALQSSDIWNQTTLYILTMERSLE